MKLFEIMQSEMSPEQAYEYAEHNGITPELEDIIATNPLYSYLYANDVLRDRFSAGERVISSDTKYAYWYAYNVLGARFYEGEKAILKDPATIVDYAQDVMHRRWLRAESIIRKSNYWNRYKKYFNIK